MFTGHRRNVRARAVFFAAVALGAGGQLQAQIWDGGHPSGDDWGHARNWEADILPTKDGSADIIMSGTFRLTPNVDDPWDIKSLKFNSSAGAFVTGGSPLFIRSGGIENNSSNLQVFNNNVFPRSTQTWDAFSGPMVFNALIEGFIGSPTLTVTGASDVTFNGNVSQSGVTLELTKSGAGTLTLNGNNNTYTGATTVNAGKLLVATNLTASSAVVITGGTLELAAGGGSNRVIKTSSLSITGSGKLDLKDNKLIVTGGNVGSFNGSAYTGITGLIASGRNSNPAPGLWDGSAGIVTSQTTATSGNFHSIGIATAQQTGRAGGVFAGISVAGTDVLVMYTYGGDANLDGKINVDDYGRIDFNVNLGTAGWYNGDFNYDGKINVDDYGIIDFNVGIQGAPFPTGSAAGWVGVSTVPEPVLGALLLTGALGARRGRRRPD